MSEKPYGKFTELGKITVIMGRDEHGQIIKVGD